MPPIGLRVRYTSPATDYREARTCDGVVVAQYRGGERLTDGETGEEYIAPDHVGMKVDQPLPSWWPYSGTDRFAPELAEIESL